MRRSISVWLHALADLFFPPQCLGCSTALTASISPLVCPTCQEFLPWIKAPLCTWCGAPFQVGSSHLCGACMARPPAFTLARSLFRYEGLIRDAIVSLKFQGDMALLPSLEVLCRQSALYADFSEPDFIIPVPLHPLRLQERGFNQALRFAQACFPQWRRKLAPFLLVRTVHTPPQTSLGGSARRCNLQGAFTIDADVCLNGKAILLIDDVFTTGTTVEVCSRELSRAGAARVEVFTLARSVVM
ncbi:MAG: ComF family protein [Desulfobulbaceae bacterium]|nr:ComF family protein [Desulfobulbaceae bacterium]